MSELVSVVIPVRNRPIQVRAAIESVIGQTHRDLEMIVVDDASEDETPKVLRGLAKKEDRMRVLRLDRRGGAQRARNEGIRASRGSWIAFLDSDDTWLPESLVARLQVAREEESDVVHSACWVVTTQADRPVPLAVPPLRGDVFKDLLRAPGPTFQALLLSRSAVEAIGPLDESIIAYQEWDTSIRLAKSFPFSYLPSPTFVWDQRGGDTISKNLVGNARGYRQVVSKHSRDIVRHVGPWALGRHYKALAGMFGLAGMRREARAFRTLGWLLCPWSSSYPRTRRGSDRPGAEGQ